MRLFISQPMRGKTDEEIKKERNAAIEECEKRFGELYVIDSFFEGAPTDNAPLYYLGESIKRLSNADIVYFCKDWYKYNGCTIEHECAVRYNKLIAYA